jgi:hypothetical protein
LSTLGDPAVTNTNVGKRVMSKIGTRCNISTFHGCDFSYLYMKLRKFAVIPELHVKLLAVE